MGKAHVFITDDTLRQALYETIDELRKQRDALLEACELLLPHVVEHCDCLLAEANKDSWIRRQQAEEARAIAGDALAAAKGQGDDFA